MLPLTAVQAVQLLEGYCEEFLYTHVDKEGLMQGTDMAAIKAVAKATERKLTAAGGITTREEIDALDALGIDAVVGMAIYTGSLALDCSQSLILATVRPHAGGHEQPRQHQARERHVERHDRFRGADGAGCARPAAARATTREAC